MKFENVPNIKVTNDYSKFSILDGNRSVKDGRKQKIKESIEQIGYIPSPIIVNEYFEVIDGQGRLAALKDLRLPVCYIVVPGLTIKHCIAMNINQSNWTMRDYIESYASQGNENYMRFLELMKEYPELPHSIISMVASGKAVKVDDKTIKSGSLVIEKGRMATAKKICEWIVTNITPLKSKIKGRFEYFYYAIAFCLEHTEIDRKRLATVLMDNAYDIMPPASVVSALKEIERVYNHRLSAKKIYLVTEYDKYYTSLIVGYKERWSIEARKKKRADKN